MIYIKLKEVFVFIFIQFIMLVENTLCYIDLIYIKCIFFEFQNLKVEI